MNKPEIKLVALDMDGTLLNEAGEISAENRKAIKEAENQGVFVVLSTGRSYATCSDFAKSMELQSYLITVNGSEIYDNQGKLVERNIVDSESIQWMWELSQKHSTHFWAISCDSIYRAEMPQRIHDSQWLKFGFDTKDEAIRQTIMDELKSKGNLEISNSSPTNIEVNALGVNKAKAIDVVCSLLNITMDNVMAVGDSLNDLAMIQEAKMGVAMGNAQKIVKEKGDWVTATNQEDGVAKAIQKWVLSN
ncbi:Cof-type HAD-IIB family hydrolase [Peribacillus sp. TH24]|uniref:Cof-type HAD-IIB family hydrolase n=1 Tax=Peribacillus sp. TH24 TaxID=2798483 RepID=UPI0019131550|nr:Cof-type HAD-IIB family hydrolase [Peribacillus sp. TH24]MBK5441968.1 HAD family phosphatase [Peribacillus sp. TH24]